MAILEVTKAEANQSRFGFKGHTKRLPPLMFLYIFDLQQSERERMLVFLSCLFDVCYNYLSLFKKIGTIESHLMTSLNVI